MMRGPLLCGLVAVCVRVAAAQSTVPGPGPATEDTAQSTHRHASLTAFPYVYYTPETELAFGAGGILTFYTAQDSILNPSKVAASAYYSTRKQYKVSLDPEVYLRRNQIYASVYLDFGLAVNKFYGVGSGSPDLGVEDYEMSNGGAKAELQYVPRLLKVTRSGVLYEFHKDDVTDKKQNPALLNNDVTGADGGVISGLGYTALGDTRDHIFFPNAGGRYLFELMVYAQPLGSDFSYNVATLDLRQYRALSPDHVLAFQAYGQWSGGDVPFYRLPALGGQNRMRGYFYGRYVDRVFVTGQVEYRQYFWRRLGFVAFAALGNVADRFSDLRFRETNISAGAGLRFLFNKAEKVNLRVDVGIGRETSGVYFGLEEAF